MIFVFCVILRHRISWDFWFFISLLGIGPLVFFYPRHRVVLDFCFCFIMGIGSLGIFVLCSIIGHRASRDLLGFCRIIDIGSLVIFGFCFILGHRISWDLCVCDVCSIIGHRVPSSSSCFSHSQKPHVNAHCSVMTV